MLVFVVELLVLVFVVFFMVSEVLDNYSIFIVRVYGDGYKIWEMLKKF